MQDGIPLKFWTPGGSSTPMFTAEHLDVPLDFDDVAAAGSMLGTTALQVLQRDRVGAVGGLKWTEFYKHESCGKCTPCREGTDWLVQILRADGLRQRARSRTSTPCSTPATTSLGRSFCALGDGATSPITSGIKYFRPGVPGPGAPAQPAGHRGQTSWSGRTDDAVGMTAVAGSSRTPGPSPRATSG